MSAPGPHVPTPAILRPIDPEDVLECIAVFYDALDDLYARLNQPPQPREPAALQRLIQHLIDTDGQRAWLAEEPSAIADPSVPRILGFGVAALRERHWFLSLLFIRPEAQRAGLGRRILLQTLPRSQAEAAVEVTGAAGTAAGGAAHGAGAAAPGGVAHGVSNGMPGAEGGPPQDTTLSTCVDALQPVSTGLYAGYGIVPRVPLFSAVGDPRPSAFPLLPRDVEALPFEELDPAALAGHLDLIDRGLLGYARRVDHEFWRGERRHGLLFRSRASGAPLGYGYTQASGRLGPVALSDPTLAAAALGSLFTRETPRGAWLVLVPGTNEQAMVPLLRSGFRFEGWPGIVASTRAADYLASYLPAGFALL